MEVNEQRENDIMIVELHGRLDANTSTELQNRLLQMIDGGEKLVVLNCAQLEYVSSAGLRVFLTILKKMNGIGGKLSIYGCKDNIKQIFEISGFKSIFKLYESKNEAVSAVTV